MSRSSTDPYLLQKPQSSTHPRLSEGQRFEKYQVLGLLGEGGMGTVYKVRQDGTIYALKLMKAEHSDQSALSRFQREAELAAAIRHPHVVTIHRAGLAQGCAFLVFEFIEGPSLDELIELDKPWTPEAALEILRPIASALDALHEQGIIHRDLKPANIFIRQHDKAPLLGDFGLAKVESLEKLTKTGEFLGTPAYMSPEQIEGDELSPAADVWAFAVLAYELLSGGHKPFEATTVAALGARILTRDPVPLSQRISVPAGLEDALNRAFEKDPSRRVKSASKFVSALEQGLLPPKPNVVLGARLRWILLAIVLIVLGLIYPIFYYWQGAARKNNKAQYQAFARGEASDEKLWEATQRFFFGEGERSPASSLIESWKSLEVVQMKAQVKGLKTERGRLAIRLRLEGYSGPLLRVKSPFGQVCQGLRAYQRGEWRNAHKEFLDARSGASGSLGSFLELAIALTELKLKNWEMGSARLQRFQTKNKETLPSSLISELILSARREELTEALFHRSSMQFVALCRRYGIGGEKKYWVEFRDHCEGQLEKQLGLEGLSLKNYRKVLKKFYAKQQRIRRDIFNFQAIYNDEMIAQLIEEHEALNRRADAYYFKMLRYQRAHPNQLLGLNGEKQDYGAIGRSIDVQLFVLFARKRYTEIMGWLSVVFALNIPVESVDPERLLVLRKQGVFEFWGKECPWDYSRYYWAGLSMVREQNSDKYQNLCRKRISELEKALEYPDISPLYRAQIFYYLATLQREVAGKLKDIEGVRRLCLELIEREKESHSQPDKNLAAKLVFLRWRRKANAKTGPGLLRLVDDIEAKLKDRYARTKSGTLHVGRPLKAPLHSIDRSYDRYYSSVLSSRAEILGEMRQWEGALRNYQKAAQHHPTLNLYKRWLKLIGPRKEPSAFKEIRGSLEKWEADLTIPRDLSKKLRELKKSLPR